MTGMGSLRRAAVAFAATLAAASAAGGQGAAGGRGAERAREVEELLQSVPGAESLSRHLLYLTEEPHQTGTPRNVELADYVRDRFREYGLEEVHFHDSPALMTYGRSAALDIVEPVRLALDLTEASNPKDKDSYLYRQSGQVPFHGYAPGGDVTADVVYAASGSPEDFARLKEMGVEVAGRIVIMRYSEPYSYRGYKLYMAEKHGAAGAIIYSDPMEDGYVRGETYPDGPWGPPSHVQWGGVVYDWLGPLPLTMHWVRQPDGSWREGPQRDRQLPRIPSLPLSYENAARILSGLKGPAAPPDWQGGLPFAYHVGPGPVRVRLRTDNEERIGTMRSVIGMIRGREEPEKWVVIGNHRDAWQYGAVDPSSGTAALLETARALGEALKRGHRPRRTIVFANWDGEEQLLGGSIAWAVDRSRKLLADGVAYVNVDSAASGPEFEGGAVPALAAFLEEVAGAVQDPAGRSVRERWAERSPGKRPEVKKIVGATDYTAFLGHLGMACIDMTFGGPYGVYHSQYDNYYWLSRIGDPGLRYSTTMARLWSLLAWRLADADVLPLRYSEYARAVRGYIEEIEKKAATADASRALRLDAARAAAGRWEAAAAAFEAAAEAARASGSGLPAERAREVNALLAQVERALTEPTGLEGRAFFRHLIYAPQPTYREEVLPRLFEAIEAGRWEKIPAYEKELVAAFERAADLARRASAALGVPATQANAGRIGGGAGTGKHGGATHGTARPPASFLSARAQAQLDLEARLSAGVSRERLRRDLERLAAEPHVAGSPAGHDTAGYVLSELRRAGLQAEIVEYVHWLSSPKRLEAEIVVPDRVPLTLTEDAVAEDPFTREAATHPGWNAYSGSGTVSAQVVYAHHGSREDFAALERMGVDLRGRILLMRYFRAGEGEKVERAERAGAAGVILYADPAEDGHRFGDVYPEGPWRPPGSIMRRSVVNTRTPGDPLSPGWASRPGARRLAAGEVQGLPRIPVLPVSYRDAGKILERLAGPAVPPAWQGGLPLTYRVGPGPAEVRLRVEMDNRDGRIRNVIARLPGGEMPDQWVILGNHHDAWLYGAGDPSSGTAALLEIGRALGSLVGQGWKPRRTLVLASFDAEEMTLGGAAEWMEEHARELSQKAVAILNMDSAVFNPDRPLSVSATGSLRSLWLEAARAVPDPRRGVPTYDVWLEQQNQMRRVPSVDRSLAAQAPPLAVPEVYRDPIGDDQTVFYLHLALPASDMYYGADYGVYHSIYENLHWMKTIVDPDFSYHAVMAALLGTAALRMAESDLLPLDVAAAASDWREELEGLERSAAAARKAAFGELLRAAAEWEREAARLGEARASLLASAAAQALPPARFREWSRRLMEIERSFFAPAGLPGAPWMRNLFSATRFESEETTLPGLRWALEDGDAAGFEKQSKLYREALSLARERTRELARELERAARPSGQVE